MDQRRRNVRLSLIHILKEDFPTQVFLERLREALWEMYPMKQLELTEEQKAQVEHLRTTLYSTWDWNFGASPACQIVKKRRVEGCGQLEVHMDVEQGALKTLHFYGDYFSMEEPEKLAEQLLGCALEENALMERLNGVEPGWYFKGMDRDSLCRLLLQ